MTVPGQVFLIAAWHWSVYTLQLRLRPHRMVGPESDPPEETQRLSHTVFINVLLLCLKPRVSHSLISRLPRQRWHISAEITQLAAGWKSYRHWQQGFLNEQTENILGAWAWWGASGTNTWQIWASCKMTFTLLFWGCIFQFWPIQTDYNLPPCGCCLVPANPFFSVNRLLRP